MVHRRDVHVAVPSRRMPSILLDLPSLDPFERDCHQPRVAVSDDDFGLLA